ncbi:hypothetical protein D3C71_1306790 [compost metagenome]
MVSPKMMSLPSPPWIVSLDTAANSVDEWPPCNAAFSSLALLTIWGWPTVPVTYSVQELQPLVLSNPTEP